MMHNNTINFYDVVTAAESYFSTIDKDAKSSGYKNFMRWVNNNEYKYFPSGNRQLVDPEFAIKTYRSFKKNNSTITNRQNTGSGWRELGPFLVENITGHYAAGIGRVEDVYVDPNNTQKIYIGSRSGGLWKTLDEGATWLPTDTENLPASGVNTIAVNPTNTNHVYINVQNSKNNYSYGIYQSYNAGDTFTETAFNPTNLGFGGLGSNFRIFTIIHHPTLPGVLFVGTSRGLFKTNTNFTNWSHIITSGQFFQIKFHPTNSAIVYAINHQNGFRNFLYTSTNSGDSFSTTSITANNNSLARIDVTPNEPNSIYFASNSGVFKSTNTGTNFSLLASPSFGTDGFAVNDTDASNMIIGALDIATKISASSNFTKTTDWNLYGAMNGNGTLEQNYFNSTAYVHADLRVAKSVNGNFYAGTDGFLAKSSDGGLTWQNLMLDASPGIRENYKLGLSQSDNSVIICGSQDNGTSIKNPNEWVETYGADGMEGIVMPLNPNYMIGSFQFGGRIRTTDAGDSNSIVTSNSTNGWWEAPLAYDPNNHFKIYDFRNGVYVSENFGSSYTYVGMPSFLASNPGNYWWQIRNAEIAQNNSDIIIVSRSSEIEKSVDGGVNFFNIRNNLPNHEIQDIAFNPNNDDDIIVVNASYQNNNQKIYRSTNGGNSWTNITYNLGDIPVHAVVIDHTTNPYIYIGTEIGVYYKPLNGTTWTLYNTNLPNVTIEELEINYGANTLKAATWGRGLWEYDLVGRDNFPSIEKTEITDAPMLDKPKLGTSQIVTSTIAYSGTLTNVEVRYSINNQLFNNTIPMFNTGGNAWTANEPLPDGVLDDKIYFKVIATGSNSDTSETYKFMYQVRDFVYCTSQGLNGTGADYINRVTIGNTFANNSGNDFYTLYDNLAPIELEVGSTYNVTSSLAAVFAPDVAAAWIDYNNNAEFESSEQITMSNYISNTATGSFTVPNTAVLNQQVRLRVSNIYDNQINPCGSFFGEVEDYLVTFKNNTLTVEDFNTQENSILVYPNPTQNKVVVTATNTLNRIELFDLRGRKVLQQNNINKTNSSFEIGHLETAVYLLHIYTNDNKFILKKIIKSHD